MDKALQIQNDLEAYRTRYQDIASIQKDIDNHRHPAAKHKEDIQTSMKQLKEAAKLVRAV